MARGKINISRLADAIADELADYAYVSQEAVSRAIQETAEETAREVKAAAPRRTGEYAESITSGYASRKGDKFSMTVYAEAPHYRLTHLLEKGHAKVNGGRVEASPRAGHWKPAETSAQETLIRKIKENLK